MKAPDFSYVRAGSLDEAFKLKALHGPDAKWLAGGQSLLATLAFRLSEPSALIDISRIEALRGITISGDSLRIGACTPHADLATSDAVRLHAPLLSEAAPLIAHAAIRNRGTIGGSLAFADPAAELPACCVALDATIVIANESGERRVPADQFFHGLYATALADDELISAVEVPVRGANDHQKLVETTRRSGDYAMAGVAVVLRRDGSRVDAARLVFFAMGDKPVASPSAAATLAGRDLDDAQIALAAGALAKDLDPPGDLNAGPDMKLHLARVVLTRALGSFLTDAGRTAA